MQIENIEEVVQPILFGIIWTNLVEFPPPRPNLQNLRVHYEIVPLKVKCKCFSIYLCMLSPELDISTDVTINQSSYARNILKHDQNWYLPKTDHIRVCAQQVLRSAWDQSSLSSQCVAKDPILHHADSEDSNQTGQMFWLIRVFGTGHFIGFVVCRCCVQVHYHFSWGTAELTK